MKLCRMQMIYVCLFFLLFAVAPSFAQQHGTLGIDFGEVSDRFGGLPRYTDPAGDVNGELVILHGNPKDNWPNVVAGGEIRFPSDTQHHATEFALFGGLRFHATSSFTIGFNVQVRKIYVPPSTIEGQVFNRYNMELLETPLVLEYKFGPEKRVFVRAEGAPEFRPRFRATSSIVIPNPSVDYAYFVKGSVGYNFGKWYAKASYENRYFKFSPSVGNPSDYNNWRNDFVTVGAGLNF
jgi:hypothetical protein